MSTQILLRYSTTNGAPADDVLARAEPAYSYLNNKLYIGRDDGTNIVADPIGGKWYTDQLAAAVSDKGTLVASKAVVVDSNKKINEFYVDDLSFDGNTIATTGTNTNLVLDPTGTGSISLHANTDVSGALTVSTTLGVTGETTLGSAIISDLTANRVVLAGTSGAVVDSSEFTYLQGSGVLTLNVTGQLNVDNVRLDGNDISVSNSNGDLTLTPNGTGLVKISTTTGLQVASGTDGTRPSASAALNGVIRYNETDNRFEGVVNGQWTGLGGVVDVDQDTYITAEESTDDDTLRFYSAGNEIMTVSTANGVIISGGYGLDVDGGATIDNIDIDGDIITIHDATISATATVGGVGTLTLDPAPAAGNDGGDVIIRGNLQVTGTQTIVNSTTIEIDDAIMQLGDDSAADSLDRGINAAYYDTGSSSAKVAFIGWDRSAGENNFTFQIDGTTADAHFDNIKLDGTITSFAGTAPTDGEILIGSTANGDLQLATITEGDSITITNGSNSIEILVDPAQAVANGSAAATHRGAASFDSAQFTVTSGHATIHTIDGGTY